MRTGLSHDPYRARHHHVAPLGELEATRALHIHAHVDRYPPFVNAGAEWMLHAMLEHLVQAGHRVTVSTAVGFPAIVDGVEVYPGERTLEVSAGADVFVGHLLWTREVVHLAATAGKPLLYLVHNPDQLHYWRLDTNSVSGLVWNSHWLQDAYPGWAGQPSCVVRPPCRVARYRVPRPGADRLTLVNPNPDKGAHLVYELAKRLPDRRFLLVAGAYGHQVPVPRGVRNVEVQPQTGNMPRDVYARTRLQLVPSKVETWGRAAHEAMCSGIPVLAHPTEGLVECCGDAGVFLDRDDPTAWVAAIEALDDERTYLEASGRALNRALQLDALADDDLAGWERLVRRAGTAPPRRTPAVLASRA